MFLFGFREAISTEGDEEEDCEEAEDYGRWSEVWLECTDRQQSAEDKLANQTINRQTTILRLDGMFELLQSKGGRLARLNETGCPITKSPALTPEFP